MLPEMGSPRICEGFPALTLCLPVLLLSSHSGSRRRMTTELEAHRVRAAMLVDVTSGTAAVNACSSRSSRLLASCVNLCVNVCVCQ